MDFTFTSFIEIFEELKYNYKKKTKKTIMMLDLYSCFCFIVTILISGCKAINPGMNEFASDAGFLTALGSMILTSKFFY